jgi:hypothetical protein
MCCGRPDLDIGFLHLYFWWWVRIINTLKLSVCSIVCSFSDAYFRTGTVDYPRIINGTWPNDTEPKIWKAFYTGVEGIVYSFPSFFRHAYSIFLKEEAERSSKTTLIWWIKILIWWRPASPHRSPQKCAEWARLALPQPHFWHLEKLETCSEWKNKNVMWLAILVS